MKKNSIIFGAIGLALLVSIGFVAAHGVSSNKMAFQSYAMEKQNIDRSDMMEHHEEMEQVMEKGSFQDLVALREKIGFNIMPWVNDETQFKEMQERHEQMEEMMEGNGMMGRGMMNRGFNGDNRVEFDCPMMD